MRNLPEVIADILESRGGMVETSDENYVDVIASSELIHLLGVPEFHRLSFAGEGSVNDSLYASYGSDYFHSLERLFMETGRQAMVVIETAALRPEKIAETLTDHLPLSNATFRLEKTEERTIPYFLIYFRFTAMSDDRHDGIFSIMVNPLNLSSALLEGGLEDLAAKVRPLTSEREISAAEITKIIDYAYKAATSMVRDKLKDFIRSTERRLNRDVKRVYEYYETMKEEINQRARRKRAQRNERGVSDENTAAEDIETLRRKQKAIDAERGWKIQDIMAKYAIGIKITPLCVIRIQATVPVFLINIKRRLSSRPFPVAYNPLLKCIDTLPCESCFHPSGAYTICDDKLHIFCAKCLVTGSQSGRPQCPICHRKI